MEVIALLILFVPIGIYLVYIFIHMDKRLQGFVDSGLRKLDESLSDIDIAKFQFYTNGHPYVWTKTTYEKVRKNIQSVKYARYIGAENFIVKIEPDRKSVYFIQAPSKDFTWDKYKHYNEWLENQENVREAISKYKNS